LVGEHPEVAGPQSNGKRSQYAGLDTCGEPITRETASCDC